MSVPDDYTVEEKYTFAPRKMRVVVIGAGISGIYMGIRIPQVLTDVDLVIYEKNASVAGTWHENKYPGAACDVPSHRYFYSFEPNPDFPAYYSDSDALEKYYSDIADKYKVAEYVQFKSLVTNALWDEDSGKWNLKVSGPNGEFTNSCDILINGSGILNNWKWPDIKALHDFKGPLLHTAKYDRSVSLDGKRVAVIGSGSSGIQVVAAIQAQVEHMGTYIRSPTWIIPPMNSDLAPNNPDGSPDYRYSPEQRERFKSEPEHFVEHRRELEKASTGLLFKLLVKDTPFQKDIRVMLEKKMRGILAAKPGLGDKMIPNFAVGCRRITPGVGYLEALVKDNVECVFDGIDHFMETGIVDVKGVHREYDVIICATGFDVSFGARFPFVGRDGRELDAAFSSNPKSYMSLAYGGFPNSFVFNGPGSPVGNGSVIPCIESEGEYMIECIRKMQTNDIKSMCIKDACVDELTKHSDAFMPRMVWTDNCANWYKAGGPQGRVTALWPGSAFNFITATVRRYDYTYLNPASRFSYLGGGRSREEMMDVDISGYLEARLNLTEGHPALAKANGNGVNGHK